MDISKFLEASKKTYSLRLKTVVPIEDKEMDRIERAVAQYNPLSISRPKKTILQKNPLDFNRSITNAEVWVVDFVFGLPADAFIIKEEIRKALDAPSDYVVVKTKNDPREIESLRLNAIEEIEEEAKKRKLKPESLLSNEPEYIEGNGNTEDGSNLFGNEYNNAFLFHLQQVRDSRRDNRVESPLFDFLKMPKREKQEPVQDDVDFNLHIKDAPKVHPKKSDFKIQIPDTSIMGNKNDQQRVVSKVFRDENGKRIVISRTFGDQA